MLCPERRADLTESVFLSHGFCGLHCMTPIYRPSSLVPKDEVSHSFNAMLNNFSSVSFFFKGEPVFTGYKKQTGHH